MVSSDENASEWADLRLSDLTSVWDCLVHIAGQTVASSNDYADIRELDHLRAESGELQNKSGRR